MSKNKLAASFIGITSLFCAACPSEVVQTAPTQPPPPVVRPESALANDVVDLSPTEAPRSLLLVMRANRPHDTLEAVEKLGKLPFNLEKLLADASRGASTYLDLGEPVDIAIGLDPETTEVDRPKFFFALSIPLKKDFAGLLDILEKEGAEVRKESATHFRVQAKIGTCEIVDTATHVPRLVCGKTAAAFRELGPWMYRGLAAQAKPTSDVSLRLELAPVRDIVLPLLKKELDEGVGSARKALGSLGVNDAELLDTPGLAARELTGFIDELDRFEANLSVDASKPLATLKSEMFFRGNQSWMTKVLTSANSAPGPVPDYFFRLPKDADMALFGRSPDPALFTGIRRVAKKGIDTALRFARLEKEDNDAILALIDAVPSTRGNWTFASGELAQVKGGMGPTDKAESFTPEMAVVEAKNKLRGIVRWGVVGQEGDPAQMAAFLKKGADVYGRGIKFAKKQADDKVKRATGDMKKWATEDRKRLDNLPRAKFTANPPGFPKGSAIVDLDISFTSKDVWGMTHPVRSFDGRPPHPAKEARGAITIRFAVVPDADGRYVWGWSADPDVLKEKLLGSLKTGKPEQQLVSRSDLGRLRTSMQTGGFFAIGKIVRAFAKISERDRDSKKLVEILDALPNKGTGSMFVIGGGANGPKPTLSSEIEIDKAWLEDIAGIFSLAGKRQRP